MPSFLRVLLAEDHPIMRESIARLLSETCMVTGTVEHGDAVVQAVAELQPDAIVMDVSMPGRSGLQILPELRLLHPQLALVILTNHASATYRDEAIRRGADGYVLKEDAVSHLWPALEEAVAKRRVKPKRYAAM